MWKPDEDGLRPLSRAYTREPAVIAEIREMQGLPSGAFWQRVELTDYRAPGCPRLETLVYFLRCFRVAGENRSAARIADMLAARVARTIVRKLSCWRSLTPGRREEIEDDILSGLFGEWLSLEPAHEFWEVRAGVCLERTISDEIDRHAAIQHHETALQPLEDRDGHTTDPWDQIPDIEQIDAETRTMVNSALEFLGPMLGQTFYLYHYQDWTQSQIAALFEVDERTVRYRLARAEKKLQEWRGAESE